MKILILPLAIAIASSTCVLAQETAAEWRALALQQYPALGIPNSEFNRQFVAVYQSKRATSPHDLDVPSWPMDIARAVAKNVSEEAPGAGAPVPIRLITAEEVKQEWLKRIIDPHPLAQNYHQIKDANDQRRASINIGKMDEKAQDEANRLNAELLRKSGNTAAADSLQLERDSYQNQLAQEQMLEQQKKDAARLRSQMQSDQIRMQSQMDDQSRKLRDISRKLDGF